MNGANQHVNLGNIYDNLTLPVTVSAWVYLDGTQASSNPIFTSQDNSDLYNGFWFFVSTSNVLMEIGDGNGSNNPVFRRGKVANIAVSLNQWNHICGVMRSPTDIDLYVNGINIGGGSSGGSSSLPMSSNFPADDAKIGYHFSNGVTYPFKGQLDEVRVYNVALTAAQVRATMCAKLAGNETGLIGYWDFNETSGIAVIDKSPNSFNGTLVNSPSRAYSGAPIGDESVFLYPNNWTGAELTMNESGESVTVSNVTPGLHGIHTYVVRNTPSQSGGLDLGVSTPPYFGVFAAGVNVGQTFDVTYSMGQCIEARLDNSKSMWSDGLLDDVVNRIEFIRGQPPPSFNANLGADETLCPFTNRILQPLSNPAGYTFLWQDGSTQPTFTPATYGTYWVSVINGCLIDRDSITFTKAERTALSFDLGADQEVCPLQPTLIQPLTNPTGYTFQWQDGSTSPSLMINDYGKYWVSVTSECTEGTDTIRFTKAHYILNFELGEDQVVCPLPPTSLTPLTNSTGYQFEWQDGSTGSSMIVSEFGEYWVSIIDDCSAGSDTIRFFRKEFPDIFIPNVITPNGDSFNEFFIIGEQESGQRVTDSDLEVFNRWGKKVYSVTNYKNNWAGEGLPTGTYYYLIRSECIPDKKGWLTIAK